MEKTRRYLGTECPHCHAVLAMFSIPDAAPEPVKNPMIGPGIIQTDCSSCGKTLKIKPEEFRVIEGGHFR